MKTENRPREAGFTLVMLVITIAIMSIMMGVAVQAVSFQMRREREAELIFRGQQYVEAIRIFKAKYGRNPMRMKEIWEADPKVIRKKWKDPITDSESWGIVLLGQENQPAPCNGDEELLLSEFHHCPPDVSSDRANGLVPTSGL